MTLFRRLLALSLSIAALSTMPLGVAQTKAAAKPAAAAPAATADLLDINTASKADLMKLPGIGDAYADRIIKGRPYNAKNQLIQMKVLPDATYAKIQDKIIAKRGK